MKDRNWGDITTEKGNGLEVMITIFNCLDIGVWMYKNVGERCIEKNR